MAVLSRLNGLLEGFAGTVDGSFFKIPAWVDPSRPPGKTSQESQISNKPKMIRTYATGRFLFWSPNLVWLVIALLDYFLCPYDLEAARSWAAPWLLRRLLANSIIVYAYFGFWHVTLDVLQWGQRPFNPGRRYRASKVAHNIYYTTLGIVQWTAIEAIVTHCYATGRLPYISDQETLASGWGLLRFVMCMFLVPIYRDVHFYFAHRLIHVKVLYKYVHSLHHRNTDVEPFAGLCMHPIEHLLYFSCALPALYVHASPFNFMWNGIHLLISPAASHSGYEDNFQSDQFHYLHHRFFECNYGTGGIPFDYWFGTFRESLDLKSSTYRGEHVESKENKLDAHAAQIADAKATLGAPEPDQALFNLLCCALAPLLVLGALAGFPWARGPRLPGLLNNSQLLALTVATGPVVVGALLIVATSHKALSWPKFAFLYPFHKEALLGAFGFNALIGVLMTLVPVYHMIHMALSEPGEGVYFKLRGL